jgi:fumarylpyruvate hydrolase
MLARSVTDVFPIPPGPRVSVSGRAEWFPVHRIYCVGQNYAAHAREMGTDPKRELPCFFTKPADAVVPNGARVPYPPATRDLHHEVELVAALGHPLRNASPAQALDAVFGYAVGLDLTRRDLQAEARRRGRPWDTAKAFDRSAPISAIHPVSEVGHIERGRIWLTVNGTERQSADVSDMIWSVAEIAVELSRLFELRPGDLIFTGTPAGVGPVGPGDQIEAGVDGVDVLHVTIGDPDPT